jgi:phage-related protein
MWYGSCSTPKGEGRSLGRICEKNLLAFPSVVVDDLGYALSVVQHGGTPPSAKPWKGEGSGVLELVEEHRGDAFRAVYTVRFEQAVYVLHCFQKKSASGVRTPRQDVALIHDRLRAAQQDYEVRYGRTED